MQLHSLRQTIQCCCGQTKLAVDAPDVLRLVCYCKDCRGYYKTLNELALKDEKRDASPASIDPWGGCDYIHLYPRDLKVVQGSENLSIGKIREKSMINRVYCKCCYTPIFSMGGSNSCLLNTALVDVTNKPPVQFRIIGRNSLPGASKPQISWSVPFSWFFTMPGRIPGKDKITPLPLEFPKEVKVFENFKEG